MDTLNTELARVVTAILREQVSPRDVAEHTDPAEVARHVDISAEDVAEHFSAEEVAEGVDGYEVAMHVEVDPAEVAEYVSTSEVAGCIDLGDLAAEFDPAEFGHGHQGAAEELEGLRAALQPLVKWASPTPPAAGPTTADQRAAELRREADQLRALLAARESSASTALDRLTAELDAAREDLATAQHGYVKVTAQLADERQTTSRLGAELEQAALLSERIGADRTRIARVMGAQAEELQGILSNWNPSADPTSELRRCTVSQVVFGLRNGHMPTQVDED